MMNPIRLEIHSRGSRGEPVTTTLSSAGLRNGDDEARKLFTAFRDGARAAGYDARLVEDVVETREIL